MNVDEKLKAWYGTYCIYNIETEKYMYHVNTGEGDLFIYGCDWLERNTLSGSGSGKSIFIIFDPDEIIDVIYGTTQRHVSMTEATFLEAICPFKGQLLMVPIRITLEREALFDSIDFTDGSIIRV